MTPDLICTLCGICAMTLMCLVSLICYFKVTSAVLTITNDLHNITYLVKFIFSELRKRDDAFDMYYAYVNRHKQLAHCVTIYSKDNTVRKVIQQYIQEEEGENDDKVSDKT